MGQWRRIKEACEPAWIICGGMWVGSRSASLLETLVKRSRINLSSSDGAGLGWVREKRGIMRWWLLLGRRFLSFIRSLSSPTWREDVPGFEQQLFAK